MTLTFSSMVSQRKTWKARGWMVRMSSALSHSTLARLTWIFSPNITYFKVCQIFTFLISANCASVNAWSPEFSYQNLRVTFKQITNHLNGNDIPITSFKPLELVTNQAEKGWSKNTLGSLAALRLRLGKFQNIKPRQQTRANHPQRDRHLPPWLRFSCSDFWDFFMLGFLGLYCQDLHNMHIVGPATHLVINGLQSWNNVLGEDLGKHFPRLHCR